VKKPPYFRAIGQTVFTEISRFFGFQDGGLLPLCILKVLKFNGL